IGHTQRRSALDQRLASYLSSLIPQENLLGGGSRGDLNDGGLARLEGRGSRIFCPGGLQCQVQKGNEALMHRPGRVLPVQPKCGDKKFPLLTCPLKKQRLASL